MAAAAELWADDRAKTWRSLRADPPEVTLSRIEPHLGRMGITRLAGITGLDRVGIPVVQAIRPLSRNLSVSQGKGLTTAESTVSAAMEAAERWHAERVPVAVTATPRRDLGDRASLDPADFAIDDAAEPGSGDDVPFDWVEGRDAATGHPILVPLDLVSMDYTEPPQSDRLTRSSNGLASGNTRAEALVSALLELIERDGLAEFEALPQAARDARRVRLSGAASDEIAALLDRLRRADLWLDVWDITGAAGVPACAALLSDTRVLRRQYHVPPCAGSGCHFDPETALIRAVTEAVQSRAAYISGARDDIDPDAYGPAGSAPPALASLFGSATAARGLPGALPAGTTARDDAAILTDRLAALGAGPVVAVDLTHPDIGLPVIRALVPGLAVVAGPGAYRRGRRGVPA